MIWQKFFYISFFVFFMHSFSYADDNPTCDLLDKSCNSSGLMDKNIQGKAIPMVREDTTRGQVGSDSSKGPFLPHFSFVKGSDHAAITIIVYWDFLCLSCKKGMEVVNKLMDFYPDEVRVVYKPFSSSLNTSSILAHEAALAASEQGKFWEMHDMLLSHGGEVTEEVLLEYAKQLGLHKKRFKKALHNHTFRDGIIKQIMEAKGFGVTSAPTFFINGRKLVGSRKVNEFRRIINGELGIAQRVPVSPRQPGSPPAPSLVNIGIGGAPVMGLENAPIVIIEYSDFQCPFCARSVSTVERVLKKYPGQVSWAFKHFPLDFHQDAPLAHKAALSAREQGKFWEMHDLIFLRQSAIKREHLIQYAKEIDLDVDQFIRDMDSKKYTEEIDRDIKEGRTIGVRGTPTFFVNGHRLVGARSMGSFVAIIEKILQNPETQLRSKFLLPDMPLPPASKLSKMGPDSAPVLIEAFWDPRHRLPKSLPYPFR